MRRSPDRFEASLISQSAPMRRRYLCLALLLSLVASACGGGPESAPSPPDGATTSSTGSGQPDATDTPSSQSPVSGLGEATVTLNGSTHHYGATSFPALRCDPDMFGVFLVVLGQVDESGNEVENGGIVQLVLVSEGTDYDEKGQVTKMTVDFPAQEETWIADPEEISLSALDPGTSQVDSFSVDGNTVSGTATAFERTSWFAYSAGTAEEYLVTTIEFEATCGSGQ